MTGFIRFRLISDHRAAGGSGSHKRRRRLLTSSVGEMVMVVRGDVFC